MVELAKVRPRCHVLLSTHDDERIRHSLELFPAYRVYVVENSSPMPEHRLVVKETHEKMRDLLQDMGYKENERFFWYGIDCLRLDEATVALYDLLLQELKEGLEVITNITGGTKIAGVAATIASSLAKCGVIYIAAEKYAKDDKTGRVRGSGFIEEPFFLEPLFELTELLLQLSPEGITIIEKLFKKKEVKTITELASENEISPKKGKIAQYSYYLRQLQRRNLVTTSEQSIRLTKLGNFTFRLLRVRKKYET